MEQRNAKYFKFYYRKDTAVPGLLSVTEMTIDMSAETSCIVNHLTNNVPAGRSLSRRREFQTCPQFLKRVGSEPDPHPSPMSVWGTPQITPSPQMTPHKMMMMVGSGQTMMGSPPNMAMERPVPVGPTTGEGNSSRVQYDLSAQTNAGSVINPDHVRYPRCPARAPTRERLIFVR